MLMKFTPVVNFTNILKAAFWTKNFHQKNTNTFCKQRKATQNTFKQKAPYKMMVKLTPVVNFINIVCDLFCRYSFCQKRKREKLRKALLYKKCTHKMLMKLTPGQLTPNGEFSMIHCLKQNANQFSSWECQLFCAAI
jgi:hypothetical protein